MEDTKLVEASKKRLLRSQTAWKIEELLPIHYVPSVEGMVVATRWMEDTFMVICLSPPFQKEEGSWAEAALIYKNASLLVKEPLAAYDYPFPKDKRIAQEVNKANGNHDMLQEVLKYINKILPPPLQATVESSYEPAINPWGVEYMDAVPPLSSSKDRLSLHCLLSQHEDHNKVENNQLSSTLMEKIMNEVSQRFSLMETKQHHTEETGRRSEKFKLKKKKKSSSSSSSSSASSSSESSSDSNVRRKSSDSSKGWVKCPFSTNDGRLATEPRKKMKSMKEERVILRKALQNLYNEFPSLKWFVETIRPDNSASPTRPYASDITWLSFHASYLDQLLLQPLAGPWTSWNELIVDPLTRSFLELVVRASPDRKYPDVFEEKVRKWMKHKRVGLTASFGSVPAFLADAKVTDAGIQPKGGWEALRKRDNRSAPSSFSTNRFKSVSTNSAGGEKKT